MPKIKRLGGFVALLSLLGVACSHTGGYSKRPRPIINRGSLSKFDIPMEVNDRVLSQIDYLLSQGGRFRLYLTRSGQYEKWMKGILKEEGLPQDLFYLALIESGFSNFALSRARALGPWQFIRSTGRIYGLKSDGWLDERKDPEKATRAAARYLKKLHGDFGNWYLALAAYNAGEGKVARAIRHADSKNFWVLSEPGTHYLKAETKNYVPRFIAAALIAKNPEKFGVKNVAYENPVLFDEVRVEGSIELSTVAGLVDSSAQTLRAINPELNRGITPPYSYRLRIPQGTKDRFVVAYADLPPELKQVSFAKHRVRKGENIVQIAKRYRVSSSQLMAANGLVKQNRKLRPGTELVIPKKMRDIPLTYAANDREISAYAVRRGDTLSKIARKFGMSVLSLKRENNLKGSYIKVGQRLTVARPVEVEKPVLLAYNEGTPSKKERLDGVEWLIRQEEKKAGGSESEPKEESDAGSFAIGPVLNEKGITMAKKPDVQESDLFAEEEAVEETKEGKKVVIEPLFDETKKASKTYVIRRGDNLWRIAKKHGVSVGELKEWNHMEGTRLRPGKKIVVANPQGVEVLQ